MSVTEGDSVICIAKANAETHVTPFPNQEWVSSWITTSVKDLSPVMSAKIGLKKGASSTVMNLLGVTKDMQGFS